jgi:DNA (cytosine-5)-methyltransferase 1
MKILNLYACLGGNRYKWNEVEPNIEVTAVELDPELARLYQERFPNDTVIVADAHQYLLDHYREFENGFVWSSPPCPTHSKVRFTQKNQNFYIPKYPDMKLYQEIIFLQNHFNGKYLVENVIPYYEPLIQGRKRGRHIYWANFNLPNVLSNRRINISTGKDEVKKLCEFHDFDFYKYKGAQRLDKIARNLVDYEAGKTILEAALIAINGYKVKQGELF